MINHIQLDWYVTTREFFAGDLPSWFDILLIENDNEIDELIDLTKK